jgi:hypothetical protein
MVAMKRILKHEYRLIEENLFCFEHFNGMLHVFESITMIPIKADNSLNVDYVCILPTYTQIAKIN